MKHVSAALTVFSRRAFVSRAAAIMVLPCAARADGGPTRILFVCEFGSVKSAIARELMRKRAAERGIAVTVMSRGITPLAHRSPELDRALLADGIDADADPLQRLQVGDITTADIVVLFNRPSYDVPGARDWTKSPSVLADYSAAKGFLQARIDALLDELALRRD